MCGIIGIASTKKRDIVPELIDSLVRLEYRGYDSAGIACDLGGDILIEKCTGAPSDGLSAEGIYKQTVIENLECSTGIGHNRWATHGKPTVQNAHPHFDTKREVIVVHNGTILNFEILKSELEKNGVVFATETDTEVIPQYISKLLKEGESIEDAFLNTIKKLEGSFGVVMMAKSNPGKLYIAKNGSPVVIGITDDSYFVSSSIHAFAPYTDRYITVEDNEYVLLDVTNDNPEIKILHLENKNKREAVEKRMENKEEGIYSKGEYETFMLKEIYEQIATTKVTLLGRYDEKKGDIHLGGLLEHREFLSKIDHLQFIACGTAYNAASVGAYLIEQLTSLQASAHIASEFRHRHNRSPKETTAIFAVSQSGETADTLECVKAANKKGYNTFGIINVVGSAIASEVSAGVYTRAGTEIGVASTKAFTSQLAVIYLLAVYFATSRDMSQKESAAFAGELDRIPELMRRALDENIEKIKKLANEFSKAKSVSFLGKGVHVPIAAEAALKYKELTYMESGAYPLGELKHGPIAIIDETTISVVIAPDDELFEQNASSIEQIKSKGGRVLLITNKAKASHPVTNKSDMVIYIPDLSEPLLYPLLEIIPLQLLCYYAAKELGRNIDKPRNLAKSVTVE